MGVLFVSFENIVKFHQSYNRDSDGHYQITGRVDDVINVTGHRLGTAEVEDALVVQHSILHCTNTKYKFLVLSSFCKNNHELAAESAVVGYPHPIKGEGIYAYVVLKEAGSSLSMEEKEKIAKELRSIVKTKISGFAVPEKLQVRLKFLISLHTLRY